jgi:Heterokaryon incompatibility protein (HET)
LHPSENIVALKLESFNHLHLSVGSRPQLNFSIPSSTETEARLDQRTNEMAAPAAPNPQRLGNPDTLQSPDEPDRGGSESLAQQNGISAAGDDLGIGSEYCSRCAALDLDKIVAAFSLPFEDSPSDGWVPPFGIEDVVRIGSLSDEYENSTCPACRFFAGCRLRRSNVESDDFTLFRISWTCHRDILVEGSPTSSSHIPQMRRMHTRGPTMHVEHNLTAMLVVTQSHGFTFNNLDSDKITKRFENKGFILPLESPLEPASQSSGICARKRRDLVDFGYFSSLLSDCDDYHEGCKRMGTDVPVLITLIDCNTLKLIHNASPDMKYAALSYVWGKVPQDDAENAHLSSVPPLINDVILATKSLKLNYLWVDRYCITKSDLNIMHQQIRRMDLVYGNAEITLVALVDNPSYGLPGVSHSRTRQPSLRIGDVDILGSMRPPMHSIMDSKWWTRAWTFQEAVLSRRRLYFTPEQAYFECCLSHHCETVNFIPTSQDILRGVTGSWIRPVSYLDSNLSLYHLHKLLEVYYQRHTTYLTDTISAFLGILQRYSRAQNPVKHYFGVPFIDTESSDSEEDMMDPFTHALSWRVSNATRRPGFPSWSWAGWRGNHIFFPMSAFQYLDMSNPEIRVEFLDGKVQSFSSFCEHGLFLPMSEQSPFLQIEGYVAQVRLLRLQSLNTSDEAKHPVLSIASKRGGQCFRKIDDWALPEREELEMYSDLTLLKLGEKGSRCLLLLIGSRERKQERIGCFEFHKSRPAVRHWRENYPSLGYYAREMEDIKWKKHTVRLC